MTATPQTLAIGCAFFIGLFIIGAVMAERDEKGGTVVALLVRVARQGMTWVIREWRKNPVELACQILVNTVGALLVGFILLAVMFVLFPFMFGEYTTF